ncbi:hypothetical protein PoB_002470000 [Plakobranchus ocellatus]|uniref:Uncharacterized protein n=1 Tax=Plakobranchus ocellatus TaxID=259542 RepID=A0AAV3ZR34_9GAST|nr:hypothetical protein PoB_002470000 [Plakobranchus ocellatus]
MLFDTKDLDSCVPELSFNTTMQLHTRQNAQRNGLNVTVTVQINTCLPPLFDLQKTLRGNNPEASSQSSTVFNSFHRVLLVSCLDCLLCSVSRGVSMQ